MFHVEQTIKETRELAKDLAVLKSKISIKFNIDDSLYWEVNDMLNTCITIVELTLKKYNDESTELA